MLTQAGGTWPDLALGNPDLSSDFAPNDQNPNCNHVGSGQLNPGHSSPLCLEPSPGSNFCVDHVAVACCSSDVSTTLFRTAWECTGRQGYLFKYTQKRGEHTNGKNSKHFFCKPMSVLLHTFHVVLCKCLICVINKVNASRSAGT